MKAITNRGDIEHNMGSQPEVWLWWGEWCSGHPGQQSWRGSKVNIFNI